MRPLDAFLAKIEASDKRFFNHGSNHVKIPMKKERFFGTFIRILRKFFPVRWFIHICTNVHLLIWFIPIGINAV